MSAGAKASRLREAFPKFFGSHTGFPKPWRLAATRPYVEAELQLRNLCQKALNIVAVGQLGSASIAAQSCSVCHARAKFSLTFALPHTAEESQIRFHYSFVNKLLCVVGELPRIYELNLERKREDIAEANNVVLKTAEERVLEDSPVRKSGNHEPLSSVFGTSPDPAIDPYVVLVVPVVPVAGVVLLADF
ncbi:hypothetical protein QQP08_022407 [Theobroma cacao]|nr:hypothetical protein QQP08_022407 [Theobroma cacao]